MTLLSFFNKTNDVLSRSVPSALRSSARQGSSSKASFLAKRSPEINKDLSYANTSFANEHQPLERALSSGSDGATPLDEWLSTPSSSRCSCPEKYLPHSDERSGRSVDDAPIFPTIDDALSSTTPLAHSHRPRGSSEPASSRYAALEIALDLLDINARSERETLQGPKEVAQGKRHTQTESKSEFIAGPRLTERYTAVEGMLQFLDAQAEHRCA